VALLGIGALVLAERLLGWIAFPLAQVLHIVGNVGWPLLLVGLGALLIMRGRTGGLNTNGKLYRSRTDRKIGGVLGGASVFLGIDSTLLRLGYAVATILTGFWFGFLLYVIAMAVVPEAEFAAGVQGPPPAAPPVPPAPVAYAAAAQSPSTPPASPSAV
jgi:phage shock protein PspC (stress-responsive transcriptional regulator)